MGGLLFLQRRMLNEGCKERSKEGTGTLAGNSAVRMKGKYPFGNVVITLS